MGSLHPVPEDLCLLFGEYSGNASIIILFAQLCNGHQAGIMHNPDNCNNVIILFYFSGSTDDVILRTPFIISFSDCKKHF
jgi:hypothetical protein